MSRMIRRSWLLGICSLALTEAAWAGLFSSSETGTRTAEFLRLGAGARAAAVGEAYTAAADDATSLYYNPAGLAMIPQHALDATFLHAPYLASSFFNYGAVAQNFGKYGAWGMSEQSFSAGSIPETDNNGAEIGSFSPFDMAIGLGWAHPVGDFSVGVEGKWIRSEILNVAQTEAFDVGVLTPWMWQDRLRLGFSASNIGGTLRFEEESFDLPRVYRFGSAWRLPRQWLATADLGLPEESNPYLALGTERTWRLGEKSSVALRAGFNSQTVGQVDSFTGFSFGGGYTFETFSLDYAFLPMGDLGNTHRISISLRFDLTPKPKAPLIIRPSSLMPAHPCEPFHGVSICEEPGGTFSLQYLPVMTNGQEPYSLTQPGPSLDLVPMAVPLHPAAPSNPPDQPGQSDQPARSNAPVQSDEPTQSGQPTQPDQPAQ